MVDAQGARAVSGGAGCAAGNDAASWTPLALQHLESVTVEGIEGLDFLALRVEPQFAIGMASPSTSMISSRTRAARVSMFCISRSHYAGTKEIVQIEAFRFEAASFFWSHSQTHENHLFARNRRRWNCQRSQSPTKN